MLEERVVAKMVHQELDALCVLLARVVVQYNHVVKEVVVLVLDTANLFVEVVTPLLVLLDVLLQVHLPPIQLVNFILVLLRPVFVCLQLCKTSRRPAGRELAGEQQQRK